MKLVLRIFITLYILLLGGQSQLHAHAVDDSVCYTVSKNLEGSEEICLSILEESRIIAVKASISPAEKQIDKVETSDNEDEKPDELISFKKLEINKYFTTVFCIRTTGYFRDCPKNNLSLCKLFSYYPSSKRYITFRVIRI